MVRAALAHVLLFIAVLSVSTMFVGGIVTESGRYAESVEDETDREVAAIDAEIEIIDDAEAGATYNETDGTVTVYVKNVGGSPLEPDDTAVLLDGEYVHPEQTTIRGTAANGWRTGSVLEVTIDATLDAGTHRVFVEVDEARDHFTFEVA